MKSISILCFLTLASSTLLQERDEAWATSSINVLQTFYDESTGLWGGDAWWQSANTLTAIATLHALDGSIAETANHVYENTLVQAQNSAAGFINGWYDDEGWWALGWIAAYDATGNQTYLTTAQSIFEDMQKGQNDLCGGAYWWDKKQTYIASIATELFITTAARLANRIADQKDQYVKLALDRWNWMVHSGLFSSDGTIRDGLYPGNCTVTGSTWSYNQGVILGGLRALWFATGDQSYLDEANHIASAAISALSRGGILAEKCDPGCEDTTSEMFKGVFMRNLGWLVANQPSPPGDLKDFVINNANNVWQMARTEAGLYKPIWSGEGESNATYESTTAGTDAIIAGVAVGS